MNNLLERLHASFFFYILTSVRTFVRFGGYLASAILVSVAMMFYGLRLWVVAGWEYKRFVARVEDDAAREKDSGRQFPSAASRLGWTPRDRPVLPVLAIMLGTHFVGWAVYRVVSTGWFSSVLQVSSADSPRIGEGLTVTLSQQRSYSAITAIALLITTTPLPILLPTISQHLHAYPAPTWHPRISPSNAPLWIVLKAFNLYIASIVISITSVLNFSLAASLAIAFGVPLTLTQPRSIVRFLGMICLTPMGLLALACRAMDVETVVKLFERTIWEWDVLGVWFLPFLCTVYLPIALQGAIVCLLPID